VTINTGPILVVEDILAIREMVEMQLKIRGYQVITARDGEEALARVAQDRPAVIIADILMPRIDGFLLVHKLQSDPQTATIPIIFLSATYVSAEDERFALDLGAIRFLSKPAEPDELLAAISDAITGQPVRRTPMSDRDFYLGYRERLDSKLKQKAAQITRNQQILTTLPEAGKDTYRKLIADAQMQYDEIQRELAALLNVLNEINNEEKNDK
jgi:CheY-like chemotaxis protein